MNIGERLKSLMERWAILVFRESFSALVYRALDTNEDEMVFRIITKERTVLTVSEFFRLVDIYVFGGKF